MNNFVSTAEAAEILGVTRQTIYNRIHNGTLPYEKRGPRMVVIDRAHLEADGSLAAKIDSLLDIALTKRDIDAALLIRAAHKHVATADQAAVYLTALLAHDPRTYAPAAVILEKLR